MITLNPSTNIGKRAPQRPISVFSGSRLSRPSVVIFAKANKHAIHDAAQSPELEFEQELEDRTADEPVDEPFVVEPIPGEHIESYSYRAEYLALSNTQLLERLRYLASASPKANDVESAACCAEVEQRILCGTEEGTRMSIGLDSADLRAPSSSSSSSSSASSVAAPRAWSVAAVQEAIEAVEHTSWAMKGRMFRLSEDFLRHALSSGAPLTPLLECLVPLCRAHYTPSALLQQLLNLSERQLGGGAATSSTPSATLSPDASDDDGSEGRSGRRSSSGAHAGRSDRESLSSSDAASLIVCCTLADRNLTAAQLSQLKRHVADRLETLEGAHLARYLWSMVRQNAASEEELTTIVRLLEPTISTVAVHDLSQISYALGKSGFRSDSFLAAIAAQACARLQEFTLQDLLRLLQGFAHLSYVNPDLIQATESWIAQRMQDIRPQGLSLAVWSYAKLGYAPLVLLQVTAEICKGRFADFTAAQMTRVAWSFARLSVKDESLFTSLEEQVRTRAPTLDGKNLSLLLWSMASLRHAVDQRTLEAALDRLLALGPELTAQSVASALWTVARLQYVDTPPRPAAAAEPTPGGRVQALIDLAAAKIPGASPQSLSLFAWSAASLQLRRPAFVQQVADEAAKRLGTCEPQHVANIMWSLGKLQVYSAPFFAALLQDVEGRVQQYKPQELANILQAFARLGFQAAPAHPDPYSDESEESEDDGALFIPLHVLQLLVGDLELRPRAYKDQELVYALWSMAKVHYLPQRLMSRVEKELEDRLERMSAQHTSVLTKTLADVSHYAPRLLTAIAAQSLARMTLYSPRQLTMIITSLAQLKFDPGRAFFDRFEAAMVQRLINFKPFELTHCLWALATLGHKPAALLQRIGAEAEVIEDVLANRSRGGLDDLRIADGLWAVVVAWGEPEHPLVVALLDVIRTRKTFQPMDRSLEIVQVQETFDRRARAPLPAAAAPRIFKDDRRRAVLTAHTVQRTINKERGAACFLLKTGLQELGFVQQRTLVLCDGAAVVDCLVSRRVRTASGAVTEQRVAVILLDDHTCLRNTLIPLGHVQAGRRILTESGYFLLALPKELLETFVDRTGRLAYLRAQLKLVGVETGEPGAAPPMRTWEERAEMRQRQRAWEAGARPGYSNGPGRSTALAAPQPRAPRRESYGGGDARGGRGVYDDEVGEEEWELPSSRDGGGRRPRGPGRRY